MRDLRALVASLQGSRVHGVLPLEIDAIATDSRAVRPRTLFVALRGTMTDGHDHIDDAISRGAAAIVIESDAHIIPTTPAIIVADTRAAVSKLADAFYDFPSRDLKIIGITGTNGKTTTAHLVNGILETAGIPCGVIGTLGGSFRETRWPLSNTTPLALELHALLAAQRDAGAKAVAMEVSSHALALGRVDDVRFDVAVLTNITRDHLDFHGTIERYAAAKRLLLDFAQLHVINVDDPLGAQFAGDFPNAITYAIDAAAAVRAEDLDLGGSGSTFTFAGTPVAIGLPGRFNVRNALAALGVARALGINDGIAARGVSATRAVPGRMERIGAFGIDAIVDYAHTPDALENVLSAVRETTKRSLIVVFGCGGDRDAGKRVEMGEIAARLADRVIVTSDNPRGEDPLAIAQTVVNGFDHMEIVLDRRTAIRRAVSEAHAGDVLVVAGKGHETYQIVGGETRPFDDREEVRIAFSKRADQARL